MPTPSKELHCIPPWTWDLADVFASADPCVWFMDLAALKLHPTFAILQHYRSLVLVLPMQQHLYCPALSASSMLSAGGKAKGKRSKYDAVVGCTIDVPAPVFGVDIPDLYYRGRVLKKDPAHPGNPFFQPRPIKPAVAAAMLLCMSTYSMHVFTPPLQQCFFPHTCQQQVTQLWQTYC